MSEDAAIVGKIYTRQEHLIGAVTDLTAVMEINQALLVELTEWLKEPPKGDLPELIRALVASVSDLALEVRTLPLRLQKMLREPAD